MVRSLVFLLSLLLLVNGTEAVTDEEHQNTVNSVKDKSQCLTVCLDKDGRDSDSSTANCSLVCLEVKGDEIISVDKGPLKNPYKKP